MGVLDRRAGGVTGAERRTRAVAASRSRKGSCGGEGASEDPSDALILKCPRC